MLADDVAVDETPRLGHAKLNNQTSPEDGGSPSILILPVRSAQLVVDSPEGPFCAVWERPRICSSGPDPLRRERKAGHWDFASSIKSEGEPSSGEASTACRHDNLNCTYVFGRSWRGLG
jgi:hypothetical protein